MSRKRLATSISNRGRRPKRMSRLTIVVLGLAVCVAGALGAIGVAAAGGSGPSANGHANLVINGEKQTFSFDAKEMPDGSDQGTFQVKSRGQDITAHGDIDCLRVDGNTATMSGVITKSKEPVFGGATFILVTVVDNGEGADAPPDLWSDVTVFFTPESCDIASLVPDEIVEEGNIQVKP
jgi:hypothetical protein